MGYTNYIDYSSENRMTVEDLNHAVEVINAFFSTLPQYIVLSPPEDVDKFYSSQCAFFGVKEDPEVYERLMRRGVPSDYHIDVRRRITPVTLYKLRKIVDAAYSTGKRESDVIFVDHNKVTGRVLYYVGHPSGYDRNDDEYSFCNCVEIDITRIGFDCFKTGRDTRIDTIYATVYGVLAAMFPACFEYSNDENYNDTLKNIAKTIPPFVAAWKTKDVAVVAKVGGKAKKVKGAVGGRRSDRLRLL